MTLGKITILLSGICMARAIKDGMELALDGIAALLVMDLQVPT